MSNVLNTMLENGNVVNSEIHQKALGESWLVDGILYLGKSVLGFLATSGSALEPIFIIVAICGFFLIMAGIDVIGKKVVSGSILGYLACKVCEVVC